MGLRGAARICLASASLGAAAASAEAPQAGERIQIGGVTATATASSTLTSHTPGLYSVARLFDGRLDTAWVEGAPGEGDGEWVELAFEKPLPLEGFVIVPGYAKSEDTFYKNMVPRVLSLFADGKPVGEFTFGYWENIDCRIAPSEMANNASPRLVVFSRPLTAQKLRLVVKESAGTKGTRDKDLAISEWMLLPAGAPLSSTTPPLLGLDVAVTALRALAQKGALEESLVSARTTSSPVLRSFAALTQADKATIQKALIERGADEAHWSLESFLRVARPGLLDVTVTLPYAPGGGGYTQWTGKLMGAPLFQVRGEQGEPMAWFPELSFEGAVSTLKVRNAGGVLGSARCLPIDMPGTR
jgi:hypothetical protein